MFKRELKINFKSFLVWGLSISALLVLVFSIYPSITQNMEIDKFMKALPAEMLKSFNFDLVSISTVFGWYSSEGFTIVSLIGALFAASLGASVILKEESDKTIEFLYSKPITRNRILISKLSVGIIYIILFNLLIMTVTGIGFYLSDDMNTAQWILFNLAPLVIEIAVFFISTFVASFFNKTRKAMGITFGITMGTYVLSMVARMAEKVDFLKFFSPFGYVNAETIIKDSPLDGYFFILFVIIFAFAGLLFSRYNRKELI